MNIRTRTDHIAVILVAAATTATALAASPTTAPTKMAARSPSADIDEVAAHPFREPRSDPNRSAFSDQYLFGDWGGVRTELAEHGIRPTALFITDPFADVSGGRRRGFGEYDMLALDVTADTDHLLGIHGGQFHVGFANNSGTDIADKYAGTLFLPQLASVADAHGRLTYLSYTQSLFNDRVSVRAGRLTINSVYGEEFAASPYFKAFTSVAFDLLPEQLFLNTTGSYGYPDATWGARVKVAPGGGWYLMGGVYDGEPGNHSGSKGGVDLSLRGPAFAIGEVGRRWNTGGHAADLPGSLKVGGYYQVPSSASGDRSAIYAVADQALFAWGPREQDRHLGVAGSVVASPDPRANPVPFFFDLGMVGYGLFDSRPRDFAALGFAYMTYAGGFAGRPGSPERGVGPEMAFEASYSLTLRPGLQVQPAVHYIIHPSGSRNIPDALVVGAQVLFSL